MTTTERLEQLNELRKNRAKAWDDARMFLDSHQKDGRMSEEDAATYDKMEKEIVALGNDISRLERANEMETVLNGNTGTPIVVKPGASLEDTGTGRASKEYKNAFWDVIRGLSMPGVNNALKIGADPEGGYLVPDEYERTLIEALEEENIFRSLATVISTASGDRKIPIVSDKGEASWIEEEGTYPLSDDTFGQTSISAYKAGTAIKVSDELMSDSAFDVEAYISREFGRRIGRKEEEAFFIGNGTGKPTGILNETGGAETGCTTSGTSITFDDMMELYYSLRAPYRRNAVWLLNDATVKALRKLKDSTGQYIWQPSVTAGVPDMIMNRPYHTSSYVPTIESGAKAIAFGDLSYYWIADRAGITFKRLNELYAMTGQIGFLASKRVDGKLILPEAVKVLAISAS